MLISYSSSGDYDLRPIYLEEVGWFLVVLDNANGDIFFSFIFFQRDWVCQIVMNLWVVKRHSKTAIAHVKLQRRLGWILRYTVADGFCGWCKQSKLCTDVESVELLEVSFDVLSAVSWITAFNFKIRKGNSVDLLCDVADIRTLNCVLPRAFWATFIKCILVSIFNLTWKFRKQLGHS